MTLDGTKPPPNSRNCPYSNGRYVLTTVIAPPGLADQLHPQATNIFAITRDVHRFQPLSLEP